MTPLTASSLRCTLRNSSAAFLIIYTTQSSSTGTMTTSSSPSFALTTTAIITLPITTSGTLVMKRKLMNTVSCTWVISPVRRVISDEVAKRLNTEYVNDCTLPYSLSRKS
ncbi:hypothetical protein D1872_315350 [compost metagenome]